MACIQAYLAVSLGPLQNLLVDYSLLSDPVLLVLPRNILGPSGTSELLQIYPL